MFDPLNFILIPKDERKSRYMREAENNRLAEGIAPANQIHQPILPVRLMNRLHTIHIHSWHYSDEGQEESLISFDRDPFLIWNALK